MKSHHNRQEILRQIVPPFVAIALIVLFVKLGFWQLDRAAQKVEMQQAFDEPARHVQVSVNLEPDSYQPIKSRGRYLSDTQIVIENIVVDGSLGYYVITPFEFSSRDGLLLVNRGWIRQVPDQKALPDISVDASSRMIRGKTGVLPRVGIRPGDAFLEHRNWPRFAVWPSTEEIAEEVGRDVLPFVLLLDPQQENGFVRHWKPKLAGPSTHYGYAFQWFAMAIALLVITGLNLRKRVKHRDR